MASKEQFSPRFTFADEPEEAPEPESDEVMP